MSLQKNIEKNKIEIQKLDFLISQKISLTDECQKVIDNNKFINEKNKNELILINELELKINESFKN